MSGPYENADDFDFSLPPELIATRPPERRGDSRMLVVDRNNGTIDHRHFSDLEAFVGTQAGDLLVLNDTRVVPARFYSDDGRVELLRIGASSPELWTCLVRPGKRLRLGAKLQIGGTTGTVVGISAEDGSRLVEWDGPVDVETHGHLALPPYMGREEETSDRERYQTVYAAAPGAVAAPTAGLHFTPDLLERLPHTFVTLHVGVGTFQPVRVERLSEHRMHREQFHLGEEAARAIAAASRVIAVGTTVVRVLEHAARLIGGRNLAAGSGETEIFLRPPCPFFAIDALVTNFHLPKSTLLMLVSAFAGKDLIEEAYRQAIAKHYRFYSYGDCMLIL